MTDEASRILQGRIAEEWQRAGAEDRLTWPVRASLLQVSVGTAKRILGRMGNDKVVLQQAFAVFGLEWRDEYCEPLTATAEINLVDDSKEDPAGPLLPPTPVAAKPPAGPKMFVLVASLSLAVLTLIGILAFRSQNVELPYDQRPQAKELAIARLAYHKAKYAEARHHAKLAYKLAYNAGDTNALSEAIRFEGEIFAAQGDLDKAVERFRTALTFRTELNALWGRSSVLIALAIVEQKLNRLDDAEANLKVALDGMRKSNDQAGLAEASRELGSVAAARGYVASARRWFDAAAAAIADRPDEPMHIDIRARKALLLADEGKHEAALVVLRECLEEWKNQDHPRWIATTLYQIGQIQWASGDRSGATESIAAAQRSFASVGDQGGVSQCEAWLAKSSLNSRRTASFVPVK